MTIRIQLKNNDSIWISIEDVNVYSEAKEIIEHTGEYICYYKFSEPPTPFVIGEMLKDNDNKPIVFKSKEEAIKFVKSKINHK